MFNCTAAGKNSTFDNLDMISIWKKNQMPKKFQKTFIFIIVIVWPSMSEEISYLVYLFLSLNDFVSLQIPVSILLIFMIVNFNLLVLRFPKLGVTSP